MGLENVKYDAFISYRHCELDSFVSENLHKKLENFKLPKSVLKKTGLKKKKIERVFRDEAELPLSDNLSDPIMAALKNSDFLIVICTPRLPLSAWCKKEIETFVSLKDRKHVLLVLAEGEPDESFPEILLYEDVVEKDLDGNEVTIRRTREPLAAECRGKNNKERLKAMDNAVIKLCAAMFGLNYDDLKQRHREQQMKRRLFVMEAAIAVVTLFAIVCVFFTIRIQKQKETIQDKYAASMAVASEELYDTGRKLDAIYAARSVLPDKETDGYNEEAYRALVDAMGVYTVSESYVPTSVVSINSNILIYEISADEKTMIVYGRDNELSAIDIESGEVLFSKDVEGVYSMAFSGNDGFIYSTGFYDGEFVIKYVDIPTQKEKTLENNTGRVEMVKHGGVTCTFSCEGVKGYVKDECIYDITYSDYDIEPDDYCWYSDVSFSEDGRFCAFVFKEDSMSLGALVCQFETETGEIKLFIREKNIEEDSSVATDEWSVIIAYVPSELQYGKKSTVILRYDNFGEYSQKPLSVWVEGENMEQIVANDYGLCLYGNNEAMFFDYDLNLVSVLTRANMVMSVFSYDKGFAIIDESGEMFYLDGFYMEGADLTYRMFPNSGNETMHRVTKQGDKLYIQYLKDLTYVSVYEIQRGEWASVLSKTGVNEFDRSYTEEDRSILKKIKGIDEEKVYSIIKSDDGKYISVQKYDGFLTVYNAKTYKPVKSMYLDFFPASFCYIEKYKSYVLFYSGDEYFFDRNFKCYASMPYATVWGTDDKKGDLVLNDGAGTYYNVEIKSYKEVIKRADEILGDYTPEQKIVDKYNITVRKRNLIHEFKSLLGKSFKNK